jgi:hypothetical protein
VGAVFEGGMGVVGGAAARRAAERGIWGSVGAQRRSEERRMQSKSIGRVCRVVQGGIKRWWYELRGGSSGCVAAAKTQSERLHCCLRVLRQSADGRRARRALGPRLCLPARYWNGHGRSESAAAASRDAAHRQGRPA